MWHGVCHRDPKLKPKIKNCVYEGQPKPLEIESVRELREWCPHMIPDDWQEGDEINLCCDGAQVRFARRITFCKISNTFISVDQGSNQWRDRR